MAVCAYVCTNVFSCVVFHACDDCFRAYAFTWLLVLGYACIHIYITCMYLFVDVNRTHKCVCVCKYVRKNVCLLVTIKQSIYLHM